MQVGVFGSARVLRAGPAGDEPVDLGARKPRSVVAALALHAGRAVSAELLADLVWAGDPPRAAHGALHAYISGLRKALDPERATRAAPSVLETTDHGYLLRVAPDAVDVHRFARDTRHVGRVLAPLASQLGSGDRTGWPGRPEVVAALDELDAALAGWTGTPYADLLEHPDVLAERAALEQLRAAAEQDRLLGLLALGEHAGVLTTTETRVSTHALQERWWALHALALTRAGRQAEALDALRAVRELLAEELGLDPGPELRDLEQAILRQDGRLSAVLPAEATPRPRPASGPAAPATPVPSAAGPRAEAGTRGRSGERRRLHALLDAPAGTALLVGEPGIGKTWLTTDLAEEARRRGHVVARGACSQDDGAPPLWPWLGVLRALDPDGDTGLGALLEREAAGESAARQAFETSDRIARALFAAAGRGPVLVVLDDLHWADDATLRTLRHVLAETPPGAPLTLIGTRRSHPEPTGLLADVGEAFARRHAVRLDLAGLDAADGRALVRSVAGPEVSDATADAWHARAAGNPFFLLELARLAEEDVAEVPVTVREVVTRRLALLPERALATLRLAAVAGRTFLAATLAAAGDLDPDDVADDLDVARAAGLVAEVDADRYAFVHALTRDSVRLSVPPTRRARLHAQVAHALEGDAALRRLIGDDERTAELARHWLAAGPSHLEKAWRAARAAADQARTLSAYRDAMALRSAAVEAHRRSPDSDEAVLFDLLLELGQDAAYAAWWPDVERACIEAMALGRATGRPDRVADAGRTMTTYCVWHPHEPDTVLEDVVDDLRWALDHVDDADPVTRGRLQLCLALELYYVPGTEAERAALLEAGLAACRRRQDPALRAWACRTAWMTAWSPRLVETRNAWAREGLAAAREAGDEAAQAVLLTSVAVDALELADGDTWRQASAEAGRLAERHRLPYVELGLNWVWLCLASLSGDRDAVTRHHTALAENVRNVAVSLQEIHAPAARLCASLWDEEALAAIENATLDAFRDAYGATTGTHLLLARRGRGEQLVPLLDRSPLPEEPPTYWSTLTDWAQEAEAAAVAGHRRLAGQAVDALRPYAGRIGIAGMSVVLGPLDGYLALALATVGETDEAAKRADAALALAEDWGFTAYLDWLREGRKRMGF